MYVGQTAETVDITEVTFRPSRKPHYSWGTASGVLEPVGVASKDVESQHYPLARVCVL